MPNLAGFAYLSVIGALAAYAVWFRGIQRLPTMVVSFLGFLSPLVATVLGFVFLGESLSGWQIVGAVLVLGAVGLVQGAAPQEARAAGEMGRQRAINYWGRGQRKGRARR